MDMTSYKRMNDQKRHDAALGLVKFLIPVGYRLTSKRDMCACRKNLATALDYTSDSSSEKCDGCHLSVSMKYHPIYNKEKSHMHKLCFLDVRRLGHFICYPTFATNDLITKARRANTLFCNLSCPKFTFKSAPVPISHGSSTFLSTFPFHGDWILNDVRELVLEYLSLLCGKNYEVWWSQKVHTCEDIQFFYWFFYPETRKFLCHNK